MRRVSLAFGALALLGAALVGCGRLAFDVREPWRAQAEEACLASGLVRPGAHLSRIAEIDGPGSCGITYPFRATALAGGEIGLSNRLTLACPMVPALDGWLAATVQPAAELHLGVAVAEVKAGSYSCRSRNNQAGARASEHAYGNAVDVMAFRLADGRLLTVREGWRGRPEEQDFLREIFVGACRRFTTVLGPGSDSFHHDHLHLDLARHDPAGRRRVCKPAIKFEPRIDPDGPVEARVPRPPPVRAEPEPPLEIEEGEDPSGMSPGTAVPGRVSQARPPPSARARAGAPLVLQPHLQASAGLD